MDLRQVLPRTTVSRAHIMLLRFGVANHKSIRDHQELLLSASKRGARQGLSMPVRTLKEAAVPVAAVYGANAAGKSNLVDAVDQFRRLVVSSHAFLDAADQIPRNHFRLADEYRETPTQFDCTFTLESETGEGQDSSPNEGVFDYGFTYSATEFETEWLYRVARRERMSTQLLFRRSSENGKVHVEFGSSLRGENRTIANLTRPNSLFLSAAAQNNHPQLTQVHRYLSRRWKVLLNSEPRNELQIAKSLAGFEHFNELLQLVQQADVGITNIEIDDIEPKKDEIDLSRDLAKVLAKHVEGPDHGKEIERQLLDGLHKRKQLRFVQSKKRDNAAKFSYGMQSKGTRTLISLLIPALKALAQGSLLVIDELDTSLHPGLARAFVSLFKGKNSNPHGAQLVFSTHDVTLLSSGLLLLDEIWMTDKDRDGVSSFIPLTDYKLRSRDNLELAYRQGRFGAVPSSDDFLLMLDSESERRQK